MHESSLHDWAALTAIVHRLELDGGHVSDRLEEVAVVEPVHPFERRIFDGIDVAPRTAAPRDFGLLQADDRLGEGVVIGVADAPDGRLDVRLCQTLRVADREVRHQPDCSLANLG